jgi:threonine aldolase
VVDLRSDTQTKPSAAMREAMARAEVGDEQEREDPTVLELERRGADLLGHEEAVYLPTATMGNQIALRILGEPGTELLVEERAHIMVSELGGAAMHSGLQTRGLPGFRGRLSPQQLRATAWTEGDYWTPRTSIVALENTHNTAGGTVWPLHELREVAATARELGLRIHLDGARLMNAAVASGTPAAEIAGHADTVTLCL